MLLAKQCRMEALQVAINSYLISLCLKKTKFKLHLIISTSKILNEQKN